MEGTALTCECTCLGVCMHIPMCACVCVCMCACVNPPALAVAPGMLHWQEEKRLLGLSPCPDGLSVMSAALGLIQKTSVLLILT